MNAEKNRNRKQITIKFPIELVEKIKQKSYNTFSGWVIDACETKLQKDDK